MIAQSLQRARQAVSKRVVPFLPAILLAAVVATVLSASVVLSGAHRVVPTVTVPLVEWSISPPTVVFALTFVLVFACGAGYILYAKHEQAIDTWWDSLSIWSRATAGGFVCAVVTALNLTAVALASTLDLSLVPVGSLLTWPLSTTALVLYIRRRGASRSSVVDSMVVTAGYAQLKGLESRTLSLFVGLVVAIGATTVTYYATGWYLGQPQLLATTVVGLACWLGVTLLAFDHYESSTPVRGDLAIVAIEDSSASTGRELTIRNNASQRIDLTDSKIRDTEFDVYRLDVDIRLGPGQTCTFEIPDTFSLAPNDDATDLPLGYTLTQGGETPVVFSRSGASFALQRAQSNQSQRTGVTFERDPSTQD